MEKANKRDYGSELESKFQSILKKIRCYSYKPVDFKSLMYLISNVKGVMDRIPKAPCDRIVIYQGSSFFFELKHVLGQSMPYDRVKDHQVAHLLAHEKQGKGRSYIIIGFRDVKLAMIMISIDRFLELKNVCKRKSITLDECKIYGRIINNEKDLFLSLESDTYTAV